MNRDRFSRPKFEFDPDTYEWLEESEQNWRLFDWLCDDADRHALLATLAGAPLHFPSRIVRQDDPAPPPIPATPEGFRGAVLITAPEDIDLALSDPRFSNIAYAALGSGSFMLGQDPAANDDRHLHQVDFATRAIGRYTAQPEGLSLLARTATSQASLTALARSDFDLAAFAGEAGLRYLSQLFGYGFQDHVVLEEASRAAYHALQYVAVAQHFATDPGVVPTAQQAVGRAVARTSALIDDYARLARSPRRTGSTWLAKTPFGVQPLHELGLGSLGAPLLAGIDGIASPLSGKDRATVCTMLIAGTLGNIVSAVCLLMRRLQTSEADMALAMAFKSKQRCKPGQPCERETVLGKTLQAFFHDIRPIPFVPRRYVGKTHIVLSNGECIEPDTDCIVMLEGGVIRKTTPSSCPHAWGRTHANAAARHPCLGIELAWPIITAVVQRVLELPGMTEGLDATTGSPSGIERPWGFACTRYPMRYDRERSRWQQNLIVSMRVKSPIAQHAAALRSLIVASVPRIEHLLTGFAGVHFAWFELADGDNTLVLRTIYDGQFEAYVRHFALSAGDLFDGLFEHIENAPPRPVAEHPDDFVETIRRFNGAPLGGYLYSAYPGSTVPQIRRGWRTDVL